MANNKTNKLFNSGAFRVFSTNIKDTLVLTVSNSKESHVCIIEHLVVPAGATTMEIDHIYIPEELEGVDITFKNFCTTVMKKYVSDFKTPTVKYTSSYHSDIELVEDKSEEFGVKPSQASNIKLEGKVSDPSKVIKEATVKGVTFDTSRVLDSSKSITGLALTKPAENNLAEAKRKITDLTVDLQSVKNVFKDLKDGAYVFALFRGEAGCGKSHSVRMFGVINDLPMLYGSGQAHADESSYIGAYAPNTSEDGESTYVYIPRQFTIAYKYGFLYLLDEINALSPEVMLAFNGALEAPYQLVLETGEVIDMHPNFRMVGTFNPDYDGTEPINPSVMSRAGAIVDFDAASLDNTKRWLNSEFGYIADSLVEILYTDVMWGLRNIGSMEATHGVLSYRNIRSFVGSVVRTEFKTKKATKEWVKTEIAQKFITHLFPDIERCKELLKDLSSPINKITDILVAGVTVDAVDPDINIFFSSTSKVKSSYDDVNDIFGFDEAAYEDEAEDILKSSISSRRAAVKLEEEE